MKIETRDMIIAALCIALCYVGTTLRIPYGNGAMVHLGTAALYTVAILFGSKKAAIAGGLGSAIFDLFAGFGPYTIWSFLIKGVAGFLAGGLAHSNGANGRNMAKNITACVIAALWTLVGYLVAWTVVSGSFSIALTNIPGSLMTSGVGIFVSLILSRTLRFALIKTGIFNK